MYAKQIAVMKGQAWNVVETLKTPDHGPLELTRRARVCVWDDIVDVPIVVPLRAPSAEMRRKTQNQRRMGAEEEEIDITALSTPPLKPKSDLLQTSPPLELANSNRFNLSRESSSMDVRESDEIMPSSPATVQAVPYTSRLIDSPGDLSNGRPSHRQRMSYDSPQRHRRGHGHHRGPSSFSKRRSNPFVADDDAEGDLGFAANEDLELNNKKVIVERLEMVKARNPVFTWC
jgi:phosphatidylinositol 4-kinase type 2